MARRAMDANELFSSTFAVLSLVATKVVLLLRSSSALLLCLAKSAFESVYEC